ncbi:hypothetical protein GUJ93_ZPchr0005g16253 [Zizania palustris]|uniref:Uncharacterized protein n=1 Tax=Zizania palustris TaxID=103762 RepID=A0A8J5SEU4_ZIZPA|nr:hypothetical protein GUJ93_ZPchr0005g16253 [Zizania palustris]
MAIVLFLLELKGFVVEKIMAKMLVRTLLLPSIEFIDIIHGDIELSNARDTTTSFQGRSVLDKALIDHLIIVPSQIPSPQMEHHVGAPPQLTRTY